MNIIHIAVALSTLSCSASAISQGTTPDPQVCRDIQAQAYNRCMQEQYFGNMGYMERDERCRIWARDRYDECLGVF